ncbi:MAG: GNAT family N-acetyltransferase [Bacteroidetes bacterium]|nr:MAG: GNAT family N-acetyltransferase [Bacteroidota bacterium]
MQVAVFPVNGFCLARLQNIAKETFYQTFIHETTEQNMQAYLDEAFGLDNIQKQAINPNVRLFLISVGEEDAGYIKLNIGEAQTELQEQDGIEIERFYVRKKFQGKGIAKRLMEQAIETGISLNKSYIWLGVAETNVKAVRFYTKYNFQVFGEHGFVLGGENQIDLMMRRPLVK